MGARKAELILLAISSSLSSSSSCKLERMLSELELETLRNRTQKGEDGKRLSCDARDNLIREQFDAFPVCDCRPLDVHDVKTMRLRL